MTVHTTKTSRDLALAAAMATAELRGQDIVVLDMREHTSLFDYFVIASGRSRRQVHAMADEVDDVLQGKLGDTRLHIEGYQEGRWIILDYGDVIIHLFDEETRMFYSLEDLWSDARPVDLTGDLAMYADQLRPIEQLAGAGGAERSSADRAAAEPVVDLGIGESADEDEALLPQGVDAETLAEAGDAAHRMG